MLGRVSEDVLEIWQFWKIVWKIVGRFWKILHFFADFLNYLADFGRFWQILEECLKISADF